MHQATIERVLACEQLPTLPGVAARVVSLTSDPDLDLKDLAEAIEHDQALSAKVLRTINSSFYGLRSKCSTINQAIVMLGLSSVKCLALGFSLVDTMEAEKLNGFDYGAFWRRGIYTGVAAKHVARAAHADWEDEAFLGGLLQDIGVIAMYQALGADYAAVVASTKGDHRELVRRELAALEVQHPEIGAMLAARWRLPDELVLPIRYHERPTAAPASVSDQVKAIALGNLVHDVLTEDRPVTALAQFEEQAFAWFRLYPKQATMLIREVSISIAEVTEIFQLDLGHLPNVDTVLKEAEAQLVNVTKETPPDPDEALSALTSRPMLDHRVDQSLTQAAESGGVMSLLLASIDGFELLRVEGRTGEALVSVAEAARQVAGPDAVIAHFAEETIALLVDGALREDAERMSGQIRMLLARGASEETPLTVSVGIAAVGDGQASLYKNGCALEAAAIRALDAARMVGGDCERTFVPRQAA